jgi:transposase
MKKAKYLHEQGYSQVKIAEMLGINRGTLKRWNEEMKMFEIRKPGEAGKLANKKYDYKSKDIAQNVNTLTEKTGCFDLYISSIEDLRKIFHYLYQHGDIKLNRKYEKFSDLFFDDIV